jgi:predicted transcriptional regulator
MGVWMKTTIEISDALFQSAKTLAQRRRTTLRQIVEEGLRTVLREEQAKDRKPFKLVDASVTGSTVADTDPARWRDLEMDHAIHRLQKVQIR